MSLTYIKLPIAGAILFAGLVSVFAPMRLSKNSKFESLGNMMASGVLLSAGLVHQLADSAEAFSTRQADFPWAMFIAGASFIGFMILETQIHFLFQNKQSLKHLLHRHHQYEGTETSEKEREALRLNSDDFELDDLPLVDNQGSQHYEDEEKKDEVVENNDANTAHIKHIHGAAVHHHNHDDDHHGSVVSSLLLMLALSVHSILAGVAIGIDVNTASITSTAIAILAHKCFEGFALGASLVSANVSPKLYVSLGVAFSFATPIGALLGVMIEQEVGGGGDGENEDSLAVAVVQAIVAGTFLYISIVEIGLKELLVGGNSSHDRSYSRQLGNQLHYQRQSNQWWDETSKLFFFVMGFIAMSFLALFV